MEEIAKPKRRSAYGGTPEEQRAKKSAADKRYRAAHKEQMRAKQRAWVKANPDKAKAARARYRAKYAEKLRPYNRERNKEFRLRNPERYKANQKRHYDLHPEKHVAASMRVYWRNADAIRARRRQRYQENQAREIENGRRWKSKNPERAKQISNEWKRQHPEHNKRIADAWHENNRERSLCIRRLASIARRARERKCVGTFTYQQFLARAAYFGWRCRYCKLELTFATLTADHQIPICRGGSNWPANLVPCCKSCNSRKNTKTIAEFLHIITGALP